MVYLFVERTDVLLSSAYWRLVVTHGFTDVDSSFSHSRYVLQERAYFSDDFLYRLLRLVYHRIEIETYPYDQLYELSEEDVSLTVMHVVYLERQFNIVEVLNLRFCELDMFLVLGLGLVVNILIIDKQVRSLFNELQ